MKVIKGVVFMGWLCCRCKGSALHHLTRSEGMHAFQGGSVRRLVECRLPKKPRTLRTMRLRHHSTGTLGRDNHVDNLPSTVQAPS